MSIVDGYIKANEEALGLLMQDNAELGAALFECLAALSVVEKESGTSFTDEEEKAVLNRISDLERQAQAMVQSAPIDVAKEIAEIEKAKGEEKAREMVYQIRVLGSDDYEVADVTYAIPIYTVNDDEETRDIAKTSARQLFEEEYPEKKVDTIKIESSFFEDEDIERINSQATAAPEATASKQPETALEWLELLPDPIRTLAITYAMSTEFSRFPNRSVDSLQKAILKAFQWGETVEGFAYWNEVDNLLSGGTDPKDLPLPDAMKPALPIPTADPAPSAPTLAPVSKPAPVKRHKKQQQQTINTDIVTAEDLEQLDKLSLDENVEISDDDLTIDDDFLDDLDLDDI